MMTIMVLTSSNTNTMLSILNCSLKFFSLRASQSISLKVVVVVLLFFVVVSVVILYKNVSNFNTVLGG